MRSVEGVSMEVSLRRSRVGFSSLEESERSATKESKNLASIFANLKTRAEAINLINCDVSN